jgi:hypothetical protein
MQYPSNYATGPSAGLGSPKFGGQNYGKGFDKTLPSNPIKHYSSNPNLSMEIQYPRPPPQPLPDYATYGSPLLGKNIDFRGQGAGSGFPGASSQAGSRGNRGELTKSLIISDLEKH